MVILKRAYDLKAKFLAKGYLRRLCGGINGRGVFEVFPTPREKGSVGTEIFLILYKKLAINAKTVATPCRLFALCEDKEIRNSKEEGKGRNDEEGITRAELEDRVKEEVGERPCNTCTTCARRVHRNHVPIQKIVIERRESLSIIKDYKWIKESKYQLRHKR